MDEVEVVTVSPIKCEKCELILFEDELKLHELLVHVKKERKPANRENKQIRDKKNKLSDDKQHNVEINQIDPSKSECKQVSTEKTKFICPQCFKEFPYQHSLIGHVEKYHPLHLGGLDFDVPLDYECSKCDKKFFLCGNMLDHVRKAHESGLITRRFNCNECYRSFPKRNLFIKHLTKFHPSQLSSVPPLEHKGSACSHCSRKFSNYDSLLRHVRNFHHLSSDVKLIKSGPKTKEYACSTCGAIFGHSKTFKNHIIKYHSSNLSDDKLIDVSSIRKLNYRKCPLCDTNVRAKSDILQHFTEIHDVRFEMEEYEFNTLEEFYEWKKNMEEVTKSYYTRSYLYSRNTHEIQMFNCHRSGYYKPKGSGLRYMKIQGTKKIDGYCPSELKLMIYNNDMCKVKFFKTHVGHDNELRFIKLAKSEREYIARRLDEGISSDKILMEIRNSIPESYDKMKRIHLINKKDVYNIACMKNIDWTKVNQQGNIKVIPEITKSSSSVLFYKRIHEKCVRWPELEEEDFVLILMTESQKSNLVKYGNGVVSIDDGLHDANSYSYEFNTIMVVDEFYKSHPCCHMLSNRRTKSLLKIFFSYVKEQVDYLSPNILVTDLSEYYFESWCEIFNKPNFRIICTQQVFSTWVINLPQIESLDKREEVKTMLKNLIVESNEKCFEETLKSFLSNSDPHLQPFKEYFEKFFMNSRHSWAFCYQLLADKNIKEYMESFHNTIKSLHVNIKTLDINVGSTNLHLCHKFVKEIAYQLKGKMMHKISVIKQRHKISLDGDISTVIRAEYGWHVPSFTNLKDGVCEVYFVQLISKDCGCKFFCKECKACTHQYSCNCQDSAVMNIMCEHIHLVCRYQNSVVEEICESSEAE